METTRTITLTELELQALKSITKSDYYESGRDSVVWDWSAYDHCPFTGKKRSGVFSSLSQKGIIQVTEAEKKFIKREDGSKYRNPLWYPNDYGTIKITQEGYALLDSLELIDQHGYFKTH